MVEEARRKVAALVGAAPEEIYFTSGATEANNIVVKGALADLGPADGHLVISAVEHASVAQAARDCLRGGWRVSRVGVDARGVVDPIEAARAVCGDTVLVSVMLVNNEVGAIEPVKDICRAVKEKGAAVHSDATQAAGKIEISVGDLGVDCLTFSAHKFHGPKGVGALYVKRGSRIASLFGGGGQEDGVRPGTPNVPGIVGMGVAAEIAVREMAASERLVGACRDRFESALSSGVDGCRVNAGGGPRLHTFSNVSFDRVDGGELLCALDAAGVACSTGPACSPRDGGGSTALQAMGLPPERIRSAVRFSFGAFNTMDEALEAARIVIEQVTRLKRGKTRAVAGRRVLREGRGAA